MKKILMAVVVLMMASNVCFAQPAVAKKPAGFPITMGKIVSVTQADAAKGTKSEVVIATDDKKNNTFLVKETTLIYDANGKPLVLNNLKTGDSIKVAFSTTKEGVQEAASIYEVKSPSMQ